MEIYDPSNPPSPSDWLALSELERIDLAEEHHRIEGGFGENLRAHAAVHAAVENQLAMQEPVEAAEAMARLLSKGLGRHEALHALGSVLAEHLFPVLRSQSEPHAIDSSAYVLALKRLSAKAWRADG